MHLENGVLEPTPQLTPRQTEVLRFIWRFFRESDAYPTHREIAQGIGAQSTNVAPWLNALVRKGVLCKNAKTGVRKIRLTAQGIRVLQRAGVIAEGEQLEF
jgi:SOS-response transcriptional repressor LexA